MKKKNKRLILFSFLGLILFVLTFTVSVLIIQPDWLLNFIRKTAVTQINKQLNGSVSIGSLDGNLFKNLTFRNIELSAESSELVSLNELTLKYDLSHLLKKKVIVSSILISELDINLHQDQQGVWNLTKIVTPKETAEVKADTSSSSWEIDLETLVLANSHLNISGSNLPDFFPQEITITELISQASLGEELTWQLSKSEIAVEPQNIDILINNLRGNDKLNISLAQLKVTSKKSQISLSGDYINQPLRKGSVSFSANPFDLDELNQWIPDFPIQGAPVIIGELEIRGDSLSSQIAINRDNQSLELQAHLPNIQNPYTAELDLFWKNINSKSWYNDLSQSDLSGSLVANVVGDSLAGLNTNLALTLNDSEFNSYQIQKLLVEAQGSPAHFNSSIELNSEFGEIELIAELKDILEQPIYVLSGSIADFDVKKIVADFPYQTEINSDFSIDGKGRDPKKIDAKVRLNLADSYFANEQFEEFILDASYKYGNYNLNELEISYDGLDLSVQGQGNIYDNHNLTYNLQLNELPKIVEEIQPDVTAKASITGTVSGKIDNLVATTDIKLSDLKYQDYQLASLNGNAKLKMIEQNLDVDFTGRLSKIHTPNLPIDSVWINTHYTPEKISLDVSIVQSDTLGVDLAGDVYLPRKQAIFSKLKIKALGQNWQNSPDTLRINFNPEQLSLRNLALKSAQQTIIADLSLDSQDSYDLKVKFDSLSLSPLKYLSPELETIEGNMSLNLEGKGKLNQPQLLVTWDLADVSLKGIDIHKITGDIDYNSSIAKLDLEVNRVQQESLTVKGYLPLQADITKNEYKLLKDEKLEFNLNMTPLNLSYLNNFTALVQDIKGELNISAKIENTLNNPLMNAQLLVGKAGFKLPKLGIDYRDIDLNFVANNNFLELKEFSLPSGKKGYLKLKGSTVLNLKNTQLDSLKFSLNAQDWQVLKNSDMDLKIDSKLDIAGNSTYPTFSGYLNVQRARLYLPTLLGLDKKKVELTTPLLLKNSIENNHLETNEPNQAEDPSQIIKNLRGNMKLSFPHNTWIASKEMNMEIGGEIEIIKNSPNFALSGNVQVVRGNYTIYGKKFEISTGDIYFQGESDFNPELAIVADYTLRNSAQEKKTLSVKVTGRLQQPSIQFLLDDEQISEGDGVSYILFGKSTAELTSGEKSQVSGSGDDNMATKIIMSQITSRVSNVIQNQLNLDVVELSGDDNWRQAQVVVGKYLTNNLFLSYEKEFSFGDDDDVKPEKITLEYEIIPNFYIQATQGGDKATGVDFIWKYQK